VIHEQIEVKALNVQTEEERNIWRDDFASSVFKKLKETNNYRLMMVENLGMKLEEFDSKPTLFTRNYTQISRQPFWRCFARA
jgi:hypothetical protein